MDDDAFLAAFEAGATPNTAFRHHQHLRLASLYVRRDGREMGGARVRAGLRRFATIHGVPHLYHETLTSFWIRLVAHAVETFPAQQRFEELLDCWAGFDDRRRPIATGGRRPSTRRRRAVSGSSRISAGYRDG
jgi:hypothetical protein